MRLAVEVIGWTGALLILGAYALLSAGKLKARSLTYHLMNIVGAAGFVVNSGWNGALPSAALNVISVAAPPAAGRGRTRSPMIRASGAQLPSPVSAASSA